MVLRKGKQYVGHPYFYGCSRYPECLGTHGAHADGRPFGVPADAATRAARSAAHRAFDRLWQGRRMQRSRAYRFLAYALGLRPDECHIGRFDQETCERVVTVCAAYEMLTRLPPLSKEKK